MKKRSPLTITISLAILAATSLPIFAQSVRFPTDAELQQLIKKFRSFAASPPGDNRGLYKTDRRSRVQVQQLTSFVKAWSQIDPTTAPFLGTWIALEERKSIYPSSVKGRVCIIDIFIRNNNTGFRFGIGRVSNGKIQTDSYILIREGNYLGGIFVYNNEPGIYEYAWPKPLVNPLELIERNTPVAEKNELLQQFKEAGCTASLPTSR